MTALHLDLLCTNYFNNKRIKSTSNRKWQSEEEILYVQALRYVPSSQKCLCMFVKEIEGEKNKIRERQTKNKRACN